MKKIMVIIFIILMFLNLSLMNNFETPLVKAADGGEGLDNSSFQLNQPLKPLTPAEKKLVAKKMQEFRNWLSKQKRTLIH